MSAGLLRDRLEKVAHLQGEAAAIIDAGRRVSYRELLLRADALALQIQQREIGPGDFVGVLLPRSADLIISIAGIVRSGAAYIPIDVNQPAERRSLILNDAKPRLVIADQTDIAGVPPGIEVIGPSQQFSEIPPLGPRPRADDPAYVIYTSGSTGQPKGVVITQRNVARLLTVTEPIYGFTSDDVWAQFHSIGFDVSVWEMWGALLHGARLVVIPEKTARAADAFHSLVIDEGVTVLCQTPSAFRAFDAADAAAGRPPNCLLHIIFAGEALDPAGLRSWFEAHGDELPQLANMYGPTESTVYSTYRRMRKADAHGSPASLIGRPLSDLFIRILATDGQEVPTGEVGEIHVGGAGVTAGYLERPALTAERFIRDPFDKDPAARLYRSGDLGRRMPDGDIEFLGRTDSQVKIRGFRVELGEVEVALRKVKGVQDAVVTLQNNAKTGPQLIAYVAPDGDQPLDRGSLRDGLAIYLPDYMLPAAYVCIERVPRTLNDKVDRTALPPVTAADRVDHINGEAPRGFLEQTIAQIFSELLDIPVKSRESDFFRLGGDSLLAVRAAIVCQERLDLELPVSAIFEHSTIHSLAAFAEGQGKKKKLQHAQSEGTVDLSPQQYALWLDLKLRSDASVYNEPIAVRTRAHLDPLRLQQALASVVNKHDVLRARLIEQDGEPKLVFDRNAAASVEYLTTTDESDSMSRLSAAIAQPLNLRTGPLWRCVLCHQQDGCTVLLLVVHHIILDGASEKILLRDLAAAYADPDQPLTAAEYSFADIVAYESSRLPTEREALEDFWAKTLVDSDFAAGLPPVSLSCLPNEYNQACISHREFTTGLFGQIGELAAAWRVTPFNILLTGFLALLRKYSGNDDLVVGSPVSLRDSAAAEGVIGYLINPVPLRIRLDGDASFQTTVENVAREWQRARIHSRAPMNLILQAAQGIRRNGLGTAVQIQFSVLQDPTEEVVFDGHPIEPIELAPPNAKFDLFVLVKVRKTNASIVLHSRRGLIDGEMGERLLHHLNVLLVAATQNADLALRDLPLLDERERETIRQWEARSVDYPKDQTVIDILEKVADERKTETALIVGQTEVSYQSLERRASAVAALLRATGIMKGDRVPILFPRSAQFVACAIGVMKCGAVYVPLDPSYPPERLRRMLDGLDARIGLAPVGSSVCDIRINWLDPDKACENPSSLPVRNIGSEDPAYIMFTSGSTGRPKGVEVPHRGIVRLVFGQDYARFGSSETWLHMAPTSFDASTLEIWAPLLHGGRCVIVEEKILHPENLKKLIRRHAVTSAWITASLFNTLIDMAPECLSGLTQILVGGEALSPAHLQKAFDRLQNATIINGYGPTENTTFTCCHTIRAEDVRQGRIVPIGRPIANTKVYVLDKDGERVPVGVPGALVAGGDGVALGYVGQPQRTEESFFPDPFLPKENGHVYRTGDKARWRPDGLLEFLGRFDDQVKVRGYRVEPGEVATCLAENKSVSQAAVIARQGPSGANQLFAYVVPRNSAEIAELKESLPRYARERLPAYMVPTFFEFLPEFPLRSNGKLDRTVLESNLPRPTSQPDSSSINPVEARVLEILRQALEYSELDLDDDLFESGGDSLLAIRVLFQLENAFSTVLSPSIMTESITARRLASMLMGDQQYSTLPAGVVKIKSGEHGSALFCVPGLGGTTAWFHKLARHAKIERPVYTFELHDLDTEVAVFQSIEETASVIVQCMRKVQPVGPYAVIGYSYGGNVAIEMVRQLIADGQKVELALIIDAYAPNSTRFVSGKKKLATHFRNIKRSKFKKGSDYVLSRLRHRILRPPVDPSKTISLRLAEDTPTARRIAATSELCRRAFDAYRPLPFPGRITLLAATDLNEWIEIVDRSGTLGWGTVCRGGVDVLSIKCNHLDLFKEPHVKELAACLDLLLSRSTGNLADNAATGYPDAQVTSSSARGYDPPYPAVGRPFE
jgi:amino acid adenylation domain-containing protein